MKKCSRAEMVRLKSNIYFHCWIIGQQSLKKKDNSHRNLPISTKPINIWFANDNKCKIRLTQKKLQPAVLQLIFSTSADWIVNYQGSWNNITGSPNFLFTSETHFSLIMGWRVLLRPKLGTKRHKNVSLSWHVSKP